MRRITKIEATAASADKKLRVAAYARVSTGSDDQLISLEAQKPLRKPYKIPPRLGVCGSIF